MTLAFFLNPRSCIGLEIRFIKPFLPLGPSCPLQTILQSDLVGRDSPLQIAMASWLTIIFSRGLSLPIHKIWIQTKRSPNCHYYAPKGCHTQKDGQHCPLIMYQSVFSRVEKPSDDVNNRLFLMNKKGLILAEFRETILLWGHLNDFCA